MKNFLKEIVALLIVVTLVLSTDFSSYAAIHDKDDCELSPYYGVYVTYDRIDGKIIYPDVVEPHNFKIKAINCETPSYVLQLQYDYDERGNVICETNTQFFKPSNFAPGVFESYSDYQKDNYLQSITPRVHKNIYAYNDLNQMISLDCDHSRHDIITKITYTCHDSYKYTYNVLNQLVKTNLSEIQEGRLLSASTYSYKYNANNQPVEIYQSYLEYPSQLKKYTYDANGNLTNIFIGKTRNNGATYDSYHTVDYVYNEIGQVVNLIEKRYDLSTFKVSTASTFTFAYDQFGYVNSMLVQTQDGFGNSDMLYAAVNNYDELGRIISRKFEYVSGNLCSMDYEYTMMYEYLD